ncbi:MAG TPA: hypothetical protein VFI02_02095 [Armatimonadota bacterium]|nr:hypothetical protein [Armatimonadota bacterium]
MASRKAIANLSALLRQTLGCLIPAEELDGWYRVLEPLTDELVMRAGMAVLRETTERFQIAPGAVYVRAMKLLVDQGCPSEGEAWHMVRAVVAQNMERADLPEAVEVAAEQIGWFALQYMTDGNAGPTRAHFLRFYEEARRRVAATRLKQLAPAEEIRELEAVTG